MIKAIFFDIDGTLVSFRTHGVPQSALDALETVRRRGIRLFIATGRHYSDLNNIGSLSFDAYVTLNGQYCYDDRGVIYKNCIRREDIAAVVSRIEREPFACMFIEEHRMYMNLMDDRAREAQRLINFPDPDIRPARTALDADIYQLMPFVGREHGDALMRDLHYSRSTRWNPIFMDVVPEGGSKKVGIDAVLKTYGIDRSETMAFGDGQNDIEMLRHAGIGVAMGNAAEEVRDAADYVTAAIDDDGISLALRHFGLV